MLNSELKLFILYFLPYTTYLNGHVKDLVFNLKINLFYGTCTLKSGSQVPSFLKFQN